MPSIQSRQTIKSLDISNNFIGDNGLAILAKFIEKNPQISHLSFDGSHPSKHASVLSLLKVLHTSNSIRKVVFPKEDISRLIQNSSSIKDLFKQSWADLNKQINENGSSAFESSDLSNISSYASLSTANSSLSLGQIEPPFETYSAPSWDFVINIFCVSGYTEWELMSKKYTLKHLSGVSIE